MSEVLPNRERRVLSALRFLADDTGNVTVSRKNLAEALGWPREKSVRQCTVSLERRGLISVTNNSVPGAHRPNTFTVTALGHLVAEMDNARAAA